MRYSPFGQTGLSVSRLAFGGSSLGSVFRPVDEKEGIAAVHTALDLGINLIDTAPFYGLTKAETVLGKALREIARDRYYLATKVGRYGYKLPDFDFSAERVTQSVDESLERLGVDYIDFIQVHDMEFGDIRQIIEETIPALRKVQAAGKVRFVGITALHLHLFPQVMQEVAVDQVQSYCHYTLYDTTLADYLPYFEEKGVAVINSAPLAMRLLSSDGPPEWHPASPELRAKCAEAAALCKARGSDLSQLALQFSLANETIPTHVIGIASPEQARENVRLLSEPLDEALLAEVRALLDPVKNQTWPSGRPENEKR